ncbi:unnamed protein product [Ectocarpus sp. 6 AP-2014]
MVHTMRTLVPIMVAFTNHYHHGVAAFSLGPRGVRVETGRFSLFASSTSSVSFRCAAEVSPGAGSSGGSIPGVGDHRYDEQQQRRPPATGQRQRRGRRRLPPNNEAGSAGAGGPGRSRAARRTKMKDESVFGADVSFSRASALKGMSGVMAGLLLGGGGLQGLSARRPRRGLSKGSSSSKIRKGRWRSTRRPTGASRCGTRSASRGSPSRSRPTRSRRTSRARR